MPSDKNNNSAKLPVYFLLFILAIGLIWAKSSYGKLIGGVFVEGLGKTLTMFASKNPYPWYKDFLTQIALPNSKTFGLLTMYGELFTALSLTISSILLIVTSGNKLVKTVLLLGLLGGMFLNGIFWLASAWTSPSTDSLNLLMLVLEAIAAVTVAKSLTKS